jgi:hypothetical protein
MWSSLPDPVTTATLPARLHVCSIEAIVSMLSCCDVKVGSVKVFVVVMRVMRVVVMMISFHGQDNDIYTLSLFGTPAETAFNE